MNNFSEFITDREIILDGDMDEQEVEEIEVEHFNLSKEWKYTTEQIEKLFDLIIEEGFSAKYAALAIRINVWSYYTPRGRPCSKLAEEHSKFLVDYIEKNSTAVSDELKYMSDENLDFAKNYVLIDEADFNLHTQRNHGHSLKDKPAKSILPTGKGITSSILGAISQSDIISIAVKKSESASSKKKRKADGKEVKVNGKVGTRTEHYLAYLTNVMDTLDKSDMKGQYLVMDNTPIHKPKVIQKLIEDRGYKCLYLPSYSPFLNPIEKFWSKAKAGVSFSLSSYVL
ncbi:hypothetical protein G6F43_007677 [Rhizopus delemar]|nr:hypothetical protein G6F43_007677 [Rhizopus delemar]